MVDRIGLFGNIPRRMALLARQAVNPEFTLNPAEWRVQKAPIGSIPVFNLKRKALYTYVVVLNAGLWLVLGAAVIGVTV